MSKKNCICNPVPEVVLPEKKSCAGKKLLTLAAVAGLGYAAYKFVSRYCAAKKEELDRGNQYSDTKTYFNIFSGQELNFDNKPVPNMKFTTVFGGVELDLTNAEFTQDVSLEATTVFGGVELKLPSGVNVQIDCKTTAGGVNNPVEYTAGAPTLYISGTLVCGGINIEVE